MGKPESMRVLCLYGHLGKAPTAQDTLSYPGPQGVRALLSPASAPQRVPGELGPARLSRVLVQAVRPWGDASSV